VGSCPSKSAALEDGLNVSQAVFAPDNDKQSEDEPIELDFPVCAEGKYNWAGASSHKSCSSATWDGCAYSNCEQKIGAGAAVGHCYTQAQIDEGKAGNGWAARGCNYGSNDNTCAYDDNGQCVYSMTGAESDLTAEEPTLVLDFPVCADGLYDWAGSSYHKTCSSATWDGCAYSNCEQKINEGAAVGHCYTQAQINEGKAGNGWAARGCNYRSNDNTCAYDDNGACTYSMTGAGVAV
jgi:hypothetical protein